MVSDPPATRVLNVDDNAPARFLRTRILQRAGFAVDEADTAERACSAAGGSSLVLLDVKLPDRDGFSVCEEIKARYPALPVVMVTSVYRTAEARRDAFAAGASAFLLDPVEPERLIRTIQTAMAGQPPVRDELPAGRSWVITNAIGEIEDISPEAARLLNLTRRGATGRNLTAFVVDNRPRLMGDLLRAAEGVIIDTTTTLHPRDRKPRRVQIDVALLPSNGPSRARLRWLIELEPDATTAHASGV